MQGSLLGIRESYSSPPVVHRLVKGTLERSSLLGSAVKHLGSLRPEKETSFALSSIIGTSPYGSY